MIFYRLVIFRPCANYCAIHMQKFNMYYVVFALLVIADHLIFINTSLY